MLFYNRVHNYYVSHAKDNWADVAHSLNIGVHPLVQKMP